MHYKLLFYCYNICEVKLIKVNHDEILEEWGQKIYKGTPLKKVFVRKIFSDVNSSDR